MEKTIKISIIIPTFDEENFIEKCLDSIFSQTYPQSLIEIFVVDGGSKDRTCEIVFNIAKRHSNLFLLRNPKRIQSAAFNIGVKESSGSIVIRMDAHALYCVNYVELIVQHFCEVSNNYGNVGGVWDIVPSQKKIMAEANAILNKTRFGIGGAAFRVGAKAGFVDTVPFGAFPRCVIDEIGAMNESLPRGEDNEYNARIRTAGYQIYFDPQIKCSYFARKTLFESIKQMYANGFSIGVLSRLNKDFVSLRHLIPCLFVMTLAILFVLSFVSKLFLYFLLFVISLYLISNLVATLYCVYRYGVKYLLCLPILFACVHISYGVGTIYGFFKKKYS